MVALCAIHVLCRYAREPVVRCCWCRYVHQSCQFRFQCVDTCVVNWGHFLFVGGSNVVQAVIKKRPPQVRGGLTFSIP